MSLRTWSKVLLCSGALVSGVAAQGDRSPAGSDAGVRLCERIDGPMAYLAIDVAAIAADATAAAFEPLQQLQEALAGAATEPAAAQALAFVRGVLGRATGEVEIAVLGVMPSGLVGGLGGDLSMPLLVLRARLAAADAAQLRAVLADLAFARPQRLVVGQQTYTLRSDAPRRPGLEVEVAVVGDDLLVANHARGIEEALDGGGTSARRVLANDARYRELLARLSPAPGALRVFADWQRFGPRLARLGGLSGALLGWSGLGGADAVAAAVEPADDGGLRTTLLLSLPHGAALDGWLALVEPATPQRLLDELPAGGLGGLVLAVEPARIGAAAANVQGFCSTIRCGCGEHGLDVDRIVKRLGRRGVLQLLLLSGTAAAPVPAFALQATSRKAAADIVEEIATAMHSATPGRATDRSSQGVDLRDIGGLERLRLGAVDDLLVFAQEAETVGALAAARRERGRERGAIDGAVAAALRAFAGDRPSRAGGVVHLDIGAWLAAVGIDDALRSRLPTRQTGFLDVLVEAGAGGRGPQSTVVRVQLLSSR